MGFPGGSEVKASTWVRSLGREDPLEKEMATHFSTLAWKIPWAEEPGGLQSTGSQSRTLLSDFTFTFTLGCLGSLNCIQGIGHATLLSGIQVFSSSHGDRFNSLWL